MGANIKLLTIGDAARAGFNLGVQCQCGHRGTIDALQASRWFMVHGWDSALPRAGMHLRCTRCGRKDRIERFGVSADYPHPFKRYPTSEEGWKRLVRRMRG